MNTPPARHTDEDDYIDPVVLDAALAGRVARQNIRLTPSERVWLVHQLTRRGETVTNICSMTNMSRRTVQRHRRAGSLRWNDNP